MARLSKELPEDTLRQMHGYYEKLLRKYPDVVTVKDVVALTGYTLTTRPQLVQPWVTESLSKGTEVLHPENLSCGFLLLPDLSLHHPQKPLAYPDAERVQQEVEEIMCDSEIRTLAPAFRFW